MIVQGLYAILNLPQRCGVAPVDAVEAMLEGGAAMIQLRSKHAPLDPALVVAVGQRCAARGVPLILNDSLELAERELPGVTGVHLGQDDLDQLGVTMAARDQRRARLRARGVMLGLSTHDLGQLGQTLATYHPDYVGFGPVFATQTKVNPDPVVGLEQLAAACELSTVPVVAIGGIGDAARARQVADAGAAAVVVIGALAQANVQTISERARALVQAFVGREL